MVGSEAAEVDSTGKPMAKDVLLIILVLFDGYLALVGGERGRIALLPPLLVMNLMESGGSLLLEVIIPWKIHATDKLCD